MQHILMKEMKSARIPIHQIENYSGAHRLNVCNIPVLKRNDYFVDDSTTVNGDAPKKFIGVYNHQLLAHKHKINRKNWIRYIAKTGSKWYPIESITELMMTKLGIIFGLKMAESQIVMIGGQLRFLSRYFLNPRKEELVHGADILAGYLNEETPEFIEEVDKQKLTREWFTVQFVDNAVSNMFLYQHDEIMFNLSKLIIFDALVGNNDRHFFNWGVVRSIEGDFQPYFSPVYDTARGLFWNDSDKKLTDIVEVNKNVDNHIKKYCKASRPKIGWEGERNPNHFRLFEKICANEFYISRDEIKRLLDLSVLEQMIQEIQKNFYPLMTANRIIMICKCLEYRFNELRKILYE